MHSINDFSYFRIMKELCKLLNYLRPYISYYKYVILITICLSGAQLLEPLLNKALVDQVLISKNISILGIIIALFLINFIFNKSLNLAKTYLLTVIGNLLSYDLRKKILNKVLYRQAAANAVDIGQVFITLEKDVLQVQETALVSLMNMLFNIINIMFISIVILKMNWEFYIIVLIIMPISLINSHIWFKKYYPIELIIKDSIANMFNFIHECFNNLWFIRVSSLQKNMEIKFLHKNKTMIYTLLNKFYYDCISSSMGDLIGLLTYILTFSLGAYLICKKNMSIGSYYAIVAYKDKLMENFSAVFNFKLNTYNTLVAIRRLDNIFNLETEVFSGIRIKNLKGKIVFDGVKYTHTGSNSGIRAINLVINPGEKIAIVGENGSGKSTLINMILGIYKPQEGNLFIDDHNICDINLLAYRKCIAAIPQDSAIFNDTVAANIMLDQGEVSAEELNKVSSACQVDYLLRQAPQGLQSSANNLSGGQKQATSIARMLLRNAKIIIFDEATSALDNVTECKIWQALQPFLSGKTFISISHKLDHMASFDKIIVLKSGKIVEYGTHQELAAKGGYYFDLLQEGMDSNT